ncbi:hypothetical protein [Pontibacillus marinus]|uniref:Uncharacterized protein n=1 Tax=Pontibacillus marinus BH030004 = DSM 16465 TaxID=1385511 RepID=A0A0A5I0W3_9BACI|nr:hypothetical protein [Pontibacillus marinus]KGX89482.1 hypothetical protein N783_06065 [Pontibacillus marinus BH030004 = DSM 16465]
MKKVDAQAAKVLEEIVQDKDQSFELNGQKYKIVAIDNKDDSETTVAEDVEKDEELKRKLLQAKKDIREGNSYTSEEMRELIRSGQV